MNTSTAVCFMPGRMMCQNVVQLFAPSMCAGLDLVEGHALQTAEQERHVPRQHLPGTRDDHAEQRRVRLAEPWDSGFQNSKCLQNAI